MRRESKMCLRPAAYSKAAVWMERPQHFGELCFLRGIDLID